MYLKLTILLGLCVVFGSTEKILRYMPTEYKLWSDNVILDFGFAIDPSVPYVNFTANVLQDIKNVDIHIEAQMVGKADRTHYLNFNTTFGFCNLMAWKSISPIGMLAFSYLREYGHLAESCPIAKGEYWLRKIWLPEDPITSTLPEVDFSINVQAFATTTDGVHVNKLILNDFWKGEALVKDVPSITKSLISMLPNMSD